MKIVLLFIWKYVGIPFIAIWIIFSLPLTEDMQAILVFSVLIIVILSLVVPPIVRRLVGKFGVQALAYIEASNRKNAYIAAHVIQFDRVDAELLVIEENGEQFRAKARIYIEEWEARTFGPHQKAIVRYLPFYKKRVAFDIMHYSKKREEVLKEFYKKKHAQKSRT